MAKATAEQVRKHYEDRGYEVRIDDEGHVEYCEQGGEWLDGRWVSEYMVQSGNVQLT